MTTLESLQAKIKKLEQQAEALIAKQSSGIVERIRDLMVQHGLTTADIDAGAGGKQPTAKAGAKTISKGSAAAVKYRDAKTGATWSGHGRAPAWIASAKNRDKFLVESSAATVKPSPVGKAKTAGNYIRGPQPAMYRDPKSGATWSGRGPAPAWLAGAKDRSRFLIDEAAAVASKAGAVSKASKPKAAGKSGVVAKKAAPKKAVDAKSPAVKKAVSK